MKKKFSLPIKRVVEQVELPVVDNAVLLGGAGGSGGGQVSRNRFRTEFEEQAKQLKEKVVLGAASKRVIRPKNDMTLSSKGTLKGDIDVIEPDTEASVRLDLVPNAKTVYENAKRPIFKKRGSVSVVEGATSDELQLVATLAQELGFTTVKELKDFIGSSSSGAAVIADLQAALAKKKRATESTNLSKGERFRRGIGTTAKKVKTAIPNLVKDERESEDPQPKEAVAMETDRFNVRENRWLDARNIDGIKDAMVRGKLAKGRGKQLLKKLGVTEEVKERVPQASDMGKPLEQDDNSSVTEEVSEDVIERYKLPPSVLAQITSVEPRGVVETLDVYGAGVIDTEIGEALGGKVSYESKLPIKGKVSVPEKNADAAKVVLEGLGLKVLTKVSNESVTHIFSSKESIASKKWWALVADNQDRAKISQIALEGNIPEREESVKRYLANKYGNENVYQISSSPIGY